MGRKRIAILLSFDSCFDSCFVFIPFVCVFCFTNSSHSFGVPLHVVGSKSGCTSMCRYFFLASFFFCLFVVKTKIVFFLNRSFKVTVIGLNNSIMFYLDITRITIISDVKTESRVSKRFSLSETIFSESGTCKHGNWILPDISNTGLEIVTMSRLL